MKMQSNKIDTPTKIDFKDFINEVRSCLHSHGSQVAYKDITSFLMGIIQKRILSLLSVFNTLYSQYTIASATGDISDTGMMIKGKYEREFITFCIEMVEILFFLLACDMRMSTSIKVVSVINQLQMFVRGRYSIGKFEKSAKFPSQTVERLDNRISDEITSLLLNTRPRSYNMMEILNILELEKVMTKKNQIMPSVLTGFLKRDESFTANLNFFIVFEIMHFIKDDVRYDELRLDLYNWIDSKIRSLADTDKSDTEAVLTFMETMSCPWVETCIKKKNAEILFGQNSDKVYSFAQRQKDLFVQWRDFSLNEALLHINSSEVY